MKVFKLAAGFAVGYVLGTRAGREKFEQIAATARQASANPRVIQAQEKAKALLNTGTEKVNAKLSGAKPATTTPEPTYEYATKPLV
ncbi:SLT domain-containing protein [Actinoplanes lutulentus]|uniref:YtxH-like protein n=1 Tax=Actinoplanes lutulentus TaxID=1287878 RepID=A0A327Z394_9ACTN|nr:hypothetical protein [Actinoplanes lutulentus]MBB2948889.1 SLT domain-containing protein [Actinoplanes lutulentus]RAK29799.1 hypothetical protein B0I29_117125 [Actinoplanes lutulentus]